MLPDKLAFVDIETTGTSATYGRIIEVGIIRVEDYKVTETYQTLINPETSSLPAEIEMLTGITMNDLADKPTFRQIKSDILEILADCIFVAHNVRFDYSFLRHEFKRENIDFKLKHFCTVKLSRTLYPSIRHHNLDAIIERFGLFVEKRHRAFADAKILWEFYQIAQSQFTKTDFSRAVNFALRKPSLPIKLTDTDLDNLPDQPGVYIFYGEDGMALYIGKSKNIRDRVLSHFSADIYSPREMSIAQQVSSIESIVTAGELGALFLEARLIKKLLPLYNRMLRYKRELVGIIKKIDKNGYDTVSMEPVQTIDPLKLNKFLGVFKSQREAKTLLADISREYNLCDKLLGLESAGRRTNTACFGYRLGRCLGACIGKEKPLFYNLRFTTAFYKTKIQPWPFDGPIVIDEINEITGSTEHIVVDKWCYLGNIKIEHEDLSINNSSNQTVDELYNNGTLEQLSNNYSFDLDMYKILKRFLAKPEYKKNLRKIDIIKLTEVQNTI